MKNSHALPSQSFQILSPTHESRWQTLIRHHEVIGLQKEALHLERKSQERELSDWEKERLSEVRNHLAEITH